MQFIPFYLYSYLGVENGDRAEQVYPWSKNMKCVWEGESECICACMSMSTFWNIKMTIRQKLKYNICNEKQNKEVFMNKLSMFFPGGQTVAHYG